MPSNLFNSLGGNMPMSPQMQMIQKFREFRENFHGDAREEVQKLLKSGRITQAQLDQAQGMVDQFRRMMAGNT